MESANPDRTLIQINSYFSIPLLHRAKAMIGKILSDRDLMETVVPNAS